MLSHSSTAIRAVLFLLIAAALFAAGHALHHTTSCFLLSFVIAYLLDPLVTLLQRRRLTRVQSIIALYLISTGASLAFFSLFGPYLAGRWGAMMPSLPLYLQKAKGLALELQGKFYAAEEWRWVVDKVMEGVDEITSQLGAAAYAAAASVVFNLFNLILSPILVFFMLHYKDEIKGLLTRWLPERYREVLLGLGTEIDESIGGYIKGQLIVSAIVAVLSSLALMALDVDYPIFNGIFAGLASTLPFIGVILATIPPLFFAYLKFQTGMVLLKVLVCFAVIYFLEGYLVKPLVFKRSMDLNPLLTIVTVMALGELFGFWGIILALPIAAALKIISESILRGDFREDHPA